MGTFDVLGFLDGAGFFDGYFWLLMSYLAIFFTGLIWVFAYWLGNLSKVHFSLYHVVCGFGVLIGAGAVTLCQATTQNHVLLAPSFIPRLFGVFFTFCQLLRFVTINHSFLWIMQYKVPNHITTPKNMALSLSILAFSLVDDTIAKKISVQTTYFQYFFLATFTFLVIQYQVKRSQIVSFGTLCFVFALYFQSLAMVFIQHAFKYPHMRMPNLLGVETYKYEPDIFMSWVCECVCSFFLYLMFKSFPSKTRKRVSAPGKKRN